MSIIAKTRSAILAAAFAMPIIGAAPASAFSDAAGLQSTAATALVKVHERWSDDEGDADRHYRRHHHNDAEVDAPFTHVETGHRVIVDAPFAHVAVGPRGRHVVAPFVDLWLPR
jgi:hypothetical protein